MKIIKNAILFLLLVTSIFSFSQERPVVKKIKVFGKIIEKSSAQPLEYATVTLVNIKNPKVIFGGITNNLGQFSIDANAGLYDIKIEFIAFTSQTLKQQKLADDTNLGTISLAENLSQLNEVVVRAEATTVEIKLDKKVYNVGKDMIVKGGSASDVLNNVPSVTVDADGNVSLRGNENVKIFIDGRPSNASNLANALQNIAADSVDKVEVISNPSARYDAEGGAGILNIVLKKGKTDGMNGSITATVGEPKNLGLLTNSNYKTEKFNFYAAIGYNNSKTPTTAISNSDYYDVNRVYEKSIYENTLRERERIGTGINFGIDVNLDKSTVWTNAINFRNNNGDTPETVTSNNVDVLPSKNYIEMINNKQNTVGNNVEYTTSILKKFKKDGHKFTANFSTSKDIDKDFSQFSSYKLGESTVNQLPSRTNNQIQNKNVLMVDYVLPIAKNGQFEMGYKGDFGRFNSVFESGTQKIFNYNENVNAAYVQFGSKYKKLSYLIGLRAEDTKIDYTLSTNNELINKKYIEYFPSAFLTYPITDISTISLNYSRRISRPRNRFINPFTNMASQINIFQGSPDINPSFTDALDLGFMTKIKSITVTSSLYFNKTKFPFQFVRRKNGVVVNGTDVWVANPINLDNEDRIGIELNANYSPFKWWRLNTNFNYFKSQLTGNYSYKLDTTGAIVNEYYDTTSNGWFVKLNSKITLPYKIDWQTNVIYTGPQKSVQGTFLATYVVNLALSKDILKEKATLAFNVSDLFNMGKMMREINLPDIDSYLERQFKARQFNLSFTYRFNKKKSDEKPAKPMNDGGGGEF